MMSADEYCDVSSFEINENEFDRATISFLPRHCPFSSLSLDEKVSFLTSILVVDASR